MNIIEARNITRMFPVGDGEFYALKHVDIDIPAGKLTILKGRSGSGKTTLMNILSALDAPTEGDVSFDGQVYSEMEDAQKEQLRRKEIGFVFQAVALIPIMNAYENVDFAMRLANSGSRPTSNSACRTFSSRCAALSSGRTFCKPSPTM